jgi:hypothetical protein
MSYYERIYIGPSEVRATSGENLVSHCLGINLFLILTLTLLPAVTKIPEGVG